MTLRTLCTVAHSLMVHAIVLEACIHLALIYTIDQIFPVLPIKYFINKDGNTTTPHKPETGMKPSVSNLSMLFLPRVIWKSTAHIDKKVLNMRDQAQTQKGFRGFFIGIPQHQKLYIVYVPSTRKILSSYDVFLNESFSSELAYTSQPYL